MDDVLENGVPQYNNNVSRLLYRAPYCDILMMARFYGRISMESLETALSKARIKYPLLNSRILQDSNGNAEFAFDYVHKFPIKIFDKKSDADWIELAWDEQKIPFDLEKGPLIKFLLFEAIDTTDVVIICHHCICDGLSLIYLIKDIAIFLDDTNAMVQPLPVPPAIIPENLSVNISVGFVGLLTKLLAKSLNHAWNKSKVLFTEQDYEHLYKEYWKKKNIGLMAFSLPKNTTTALIEKCRAKQVSVNSALTTAFSLAQYDLQGNKQSYLKKALLAIDIRHLFKDNPGENFGFLAIGNEIYLPSGKDEFWSIAKKFNTKIKEMLADPKKFLSLMAPLDYIEPTLFDAIYFAESGTLKNKTATRFKNIILSKTGKPKRSLDITNLGIVKDYNSNLKTIFFIPIISSNYEKTLGIVTINGEMNIVIMHDHSVIRQDTIEKFIQRILSYIEESV